MTRLLVLALIAGMALAVYAFVRFFFYFKLGYDLVDSIFAALLLAAESFMILHAFGFILNILRLEKNTKQIRSKHFGDGEHPSVAVVVPAKHEPRDVLERTLCTLKLMEYPNYHVYLLDGSVDPSFIRQSREIATRFDVRYFHPNVLHGAKAGMINDFLKTMEEEYLVIFDADQNPMPDFITQMVGIAEYNRRIAFVQSPQFYSNLSSSPIAKGSALQQAVFYENICEGKDRANAMFCCGTNVLFRKSALLEVGGLDEGSITEDFATSVKIHMKGYLSVYHPHVRVFGLAPENLQSYFKQQYRWSAGSIGVFRKLVVGFFRNPSALTPGQWWEYFLSSTYYFVGWAFFILMMAPILYLIYDVPTFFASPKVYFFTFAPYFLLTLVVFYSSMKKRHYDLFEVYNGIILASVSFPILMESAFMALLGKKSPFTITPKGRVENIPLWELWPWILMIGLNAVAILLGMRRFLGNPTAITINVMWASYHIFILSHVFHLNNLKKNYKRYEL